MAHVRLSRFQTTDGGFDPRAGTKTGEVRAAMGEIDLTFSGTELPLLHPFPLTPFAIPRLSRPDFFYLY